MTLANLLDINLDGFTTYPQSPPSATLDERPRNPLAMSLLSMPDDVIIEVLSHCDCMTDMDNLRLSSPRIYTIYLNHQFDILRAYIVRNYSATATVDEIYQLAAVMKHGRVHGDNGIYIDTPIDVYFRASHDSIPRLLRKAKPSSRRGMSVTLSLGDLGMLESICRTISEWIQTIPMVRFRQAPADMRRSLRPAEKVRVSRAVVRWWRYSLQFHGKLGWMISRPWDEPFYRYPPGPDESPDTITYRTFQVALMGLRFRLQEDDAGYDSRPSDMDERVRAWVQFSMLHGNEFLGTPIPYYDDRSTGRAFMRMLNTAELLELRDLFDCAYQMVALDLCPSVERLREIMGHEWRDSRTRNLAWGSGLYNHIVVNTYLKLPPNDLLRLWKAKVDKQAARAVIRHMAREMIPRLAASRQTLTSSVDTVLGERKLVWDAAVSGPENNCMATEHNNNLFHADNNPCGDAMWFNPPPLLQASGGLLDAETAGGATMVMDGRYWDDASTTEGARPDSLAEHMDMGARIVPRATPRAGWWEDVSVVRMAESHWRGNDGMPSPIWGDVCVHFDCVWSCREATCRPAGPYGEDLSLGASLWEG